MANYKNCTINEIAGGFIVVSDTTNVGYLQRSSYAYADWESVWNKKGECTRIKSGYFKELNLEYLKTPPAPVKEQRGIVRTKVEDKWNLENWRKARRAFARHKKAVMVYLGLEKPVELENYRIIVNDWRDELKIVEGRLGEKTYVTKGGTKGSRNASCVRSTKEKEKLVAEYERMRTEFVANKVAYFKKIFEEN